jgi:hypothetical protein
MNSADKIAAFVIGALVITFSGIVYHAETHRITDEDIQAARTKYGCVATNNFVGKYAVLVC